MLRVDGLPYETNMIVMTLDGKVIKKIENKGLSIDGDQLSWDGRDDKGQIVTTGVYIYFIETNGLSSMKKMIFLK